MEILCKIHKKERRKLHMVMEIFMIRQIQFLKIKYIKYKYKVSYKEKIENSK